MELRRKKRIKRAEAETRLPYIPEGIVVHILAKLPVKSLLRLRYVSKNWHSLISDPKFNLSTQRQQVIVMSMPMRQSEYQKSASVHLIDDEASVKELPMPEPLRGALANGGPQLRGSCNGLVLVSYDHDLFLWNPLTGWCNKVLSYWRLGNYKHGLRLFLSGLCYDSSTDDYKVVIASRASYLVMVGSCRNKSWTEVHFPHCKGYLESGPTMNDRVHWLVRNREDPCSQVKPYYIVSFDPQMNEFVVVPMPQNERIKGTFVHSFGVLGGCLSMAVSTGHEMYKVTDVEVFAMKKYGDKASWTSLFIISRLIVFNPRYLSLVPLCSTTEGEVLFQREVKGAIIAYNLEHNSYRGVRFPSHRGHIYCITSFVGSPVSPPNYNSETEGHTETFLSGEMQKYDKKGCRLSR